MPPCDLGTLTRDPGTSSCGMGVYEGGGDAASACSAAPSAATVATEGRPAWSGGWQCGCAGVVVWRGGGCTDPTSLFTTCGVHKTRGGIHLQVGKRRQGGVQ